MIGPGATAMAVTAVLHDGLVSSLERGWNGPRERTLVEVLRRTDFALLHVGVPRQPPLQGWQGRPQADQTRQRMSIQLPDVHRVVVEVSVLHSPWTSNVIVQASADITEEDDMKLSWRPILAGLAAAAVTTTLSFGFGISLRPRPWPRAQRRRADG